VDTFFVGRTQANKVKPFIIKDGETFIDEAVIQSLTFNKLSAADGSLIFTPTVYDDLGNVTEEGKLKADYINAGNLNVASAAVFSGDVTSEDFVRDQSGWQILQNGVVEINNIKARGNIDGSLISGSTIKGSVIEGSAFVAATEFGGNYVGLTSNLAWSDSGGKTTGWRYSNYVNIYSGNYSDTSEYRRYRRSNIDATLTISAAASDKLRLDVRVIVYEGSTLVIDTGYHGDPGYWSGTGWSLRTQESSYESCDTGCSGGSCDVTYGNGGSVFRLNNYYFNGNSKLRFRVYTEYPASYSVSTSAINDY